MAVPRRQLAEQFYYHTGDLTIARHDHCPCQVFPEFLGN
jgi:hypothetical protein